MIPRKRLDIGWRDVLRGIGFCLLPGLRPAVEAQLERTWPGGDVSSPPLSALSVRSGFDALLTALSLPVDSEILVSAATIRDMPRIIAAHGLVPVPVDLDVRRLAINPESLNRSATDRTRAILVAHLFGSRMPLEPILEFARKHGLLVIEDCAQAFAGTEWLGSPQSDVRMFSFGPIKTATAFGGAIFCFRDPAMREAVRAEQQRWPIQSRWSYLVRLIKYAGLMLLISRGLYSLFVWACRFFGTNHDQVISRNVRGFAGADFFSRIRRRPSTPLLQLLERRLRTFDPVTIAERVAAAERVISRIPRISRPGELAAEHTHWVFPILHDEPDKLMRWLWSQGFDATRGASSMGAVEPPADRLHLAPTAIQQAFERVVYLPVDRTYSPESLDRLVQALLEFEAQRSTGSKRALSEPHAS